MLRKQIKYRKDTFESMQDEHCHGDCSLHNRYIYMYQKYTQMFYERLRRTYHKQVKTCIDQRNDWTYGMKNTAQSLAEYTCVKH